MPPRPAHRACPICAVVCAVWGDNRRAGDPADRADFAQRDPLSDTGADELTQRLRVHRVVGPSLAQDAFAQAAGTPERAGKRRLNQQVNVPIQRILGGPPIGQKRMGGPPRDWLVAFPTRTFGKISPVGLDSANRLTWQDTLQPA
ncbi:hypothetical protein [Oceaniovalibus sp. ACAM 378]|uniref:hypothetical protein n=1 Tax=Oceaniovalibus sp. ACAM 378 TaxID=2599923 RepID=UPI0011D5DC1C|nr:hypothetical protein [Oceaniovalibus sp. ACAM 378]TYB89044.1 hypothetical protein FQ320_08945 [Oceaniovalibus sp. ACAM 378]